ncbi:MAG: (Fe-S)-binding protein, partial [Candidatus Roizmanbacteria bacterium]|nr:(Fe-S)-binding protein [Candidatus Roizmanbacteria bacterium]
LGLMKFWKDMKQAGGVTSGNLTGSIVETAKEFLGHSRFKDCGVSRDRFLSHFLVFYGFVLLGIATAIGVLYIDILGKESPFALSSPIKIFGNIGALALFLGINLMVINRIKNAGKVGIGSYFDWLLIFIIYVIMASGILSELTRMADIAGLAYPIYFIHLVFVFSLFLYLPYSKLAHIFYRTAAICYSKYSGRG